MDVGDMLALLRLDDDLVLRDLVQAVGDPLLLADIDAEFEAGLDWLGEIIAEPGHTATADDVVEVIQSILDALPPDLDLDPVAASAPPESCVASWSTRHPSSREPDTNHGVPRDRCT
jgi:hypothetical protein